MGLYINPVSDSIDILYIPENVAIRLIPNSPGYNCNNDVYSCLRTVNSEADFVHRRKSCEALINRCMNELEQSILGDCVVNQTIEKAGISRRLAPVELLRKVLVTPTSETIISLAVLWTTMKRLNRLILYSCDPNKYSVELQRETETTPFENWSPSENLDWLLLELDLDITIRPVQVEVARQMIKMPGNKNGVMQLNMGEGKTSVIIPMIVSKLTSARNVLCRVTVLNSIFTTNFNLLGVTIGGLLNKRLYTVPCKRDMDIDDYLTPISVTYKECMKLGGVVMTLPEYRLSFRLKMYNSFLKGCTRMDIDDIDSWFRPSRFSKVDGNTGMSMYNIESWLRQTARDLVDESDEVYSVKYQLIYTTGLQEKVDGGDLRWKVCQKLLELVPVVGAELLKQFGSDAVEFNPEDASKQRKRFNYIRILSEDCRVKEAFSELMVEGILEGKVNLLKGLLLNDKERKLVKDFLIDDNIDEIRHKEFMAFMALLNSIEKQQILLLICGYLRRGILFAALRKRWRVDYGVKLPGSQGDIKLTAVPFRAKDVAAERTEFGHPDMAIILTQLSYFYSGLSDDQLLECFQLLENTITAPEVVYNFWIEEINPEVIESETVKCYRSINLQDNRQRNDFLFPILRYHTSVINFWLENIAFPKECKQFPGKLAATAYDLCYESAHATTGFSGTNDTSMLLPVQITQQDLSVLSKTNIVMEETLGRTENSYKRTLATGVDCKTIISYLTTSQDNLRVLIDAGALMLELGNEEIAQLWLSSDKSLEAVVYFSKKGEMLVKVRNSQGNTKHGRDSPFVLSPYKDRLDNCAVYLDDEHTRGTDIKLPSTFRGCVTVGSGMRRDKLIQACMRMRKLGKGQSVHFYLSQDVHNKIIKSKQFSVIESGVDGDVDNVAISVTDIINWSKENSKEFEKDGLVYWAMNAKNYGKNLIAEDLFKMDKNGENLAVRCEDPDGQSIEAMYGTFYHIILVTEVIPLWFRGVVRKLCSPDNRPLPEHLLAKLKSIETAVLIKCQEQIKDKVYFHSMLEEEHEKELEPEHTREKQIHRPKMETPLPPNLHPNVEKAFLTGDRATICEGIWKLYKIFENTTIRNLVLQVGGSSESYFVTEDFINTIETSPYSRNKTDEFLKNIRFVASFFGESGITLLVLSQYEVNCLVTRLRLGQCAPGTRLHMFSSRWMERQDAFVTDSRLELPVRRNISTVTLSEDVIAPLRVASGNLYFSSSEEEKAFAKYLGLALKPWTNTEKEAFEKGMISKNGFVLPICPSLRQGCIFERDPTDMVRGILRVRNDALREVDHVLRMLDTCKGVFPGSAK